AVVQLVLVDCEMRAEAVSRAKLDFAVRRRCVVDSGELEGSWGIRCRSHGRSLLQFENGQKRLLGHLYAADGLHAFLAFFLLLEEFALAADVTTVALGRHVFA